MSDLKRFSYQELVIGFVASLSLWPILRWWIFLVAPLSGLLWMAGGTYNKLIRRLGVPLLIYLSVSLHIPYQWWHLASLPLGFAILSIGDGYPDTRLSTLDEGSWLGRCVDTIIDDPELGGVITKWLIPIIFQLSLVPYYIPQ